MAWPSCSVMNVVLRKTASPFMAKRMPIQKEGAA